MSIHDPTLYVGFPTPLLAGHIRTHSVETAVVLAPASPTCPSVTMTRLPQGSRTREKIMIHWYHLIASAYVLMISHNCSTCLHHFGVLHSFSSNYSVLDRLLRYMAWIGIEAAKITCWIWSLSWTSWSFCWNSFVCDKAKRAGAVTAANAINWFKKTAPQRRIYFGSPE